MKISHCLFVVLFLSTLRIFSLAFIPEDNYLINCGGSTLNNTMNDIRTFLGDLTKEGSVFLSGTKDTSFIDQSPIRNTSPLYQTARVFIKKFSYEFHIKKKGLHMIRLHLFPFYSNKYNLDSPKFHASVNGISVLHDFTSALNTSGNNSVALKEYVIMVNQEKLVIMFTPVTRSGSRPGFGFINAVEVFSIPDNLISVLGVNLVGSNQKEEHEGPSSPVFETVYRINVGGRIIPPLNDALWRSWILDENFLLLKDAAKAVARNTSLNYEDEEASRELAPDQVYMTAQEMNKNNMSTAKNFNVTWDFPLSSNAGRINYLVRMHFCDIVSLSLNQLYFDVYINGYAAYENVNLSQFTPSRMASPHHLDFIMNSENLDSMWVSVGRSNLSDPARGSAILNGIEIWKVVDRDESSSKIGGIAAVVGEVLGGFALLCVASFVVIKRRKSCGTSSRNSGINLTQMGFNINFQDIQSATSNFDKKLIIGSGGFGIVYKGVPRDSTEVAVKRSHPGSRQGLAEFQSEISILSKIRHRHLVSMVGYCEEHGEMILVYEFMKKGALRNHLYGSDLPPLSWKQRLEICIGAAKGLHYLHTGSAQGGIIHRDVKSSNILLDENYVARVADFGLSRLGPCHDETHVSTGVKGSFGYLDPEYFKRQQLTNKSDVYSFGVVLLEVLCARPAIDPSLLRDQVNLAEWAMLLIKMGFLEQIIDPKLSGDMNPKSLEVFSETAEKCLSAYGIDRPTMGEVLWKLDHSLHIQKTWKPREPREGGIVFDAPELTENTEIPHPTSTNARFKAEDNGENSSTVFSQIITN